MPTNIVISRTSDLTVDLSVKTRTMSSSETDVRVKLITENDEIKIFECEIHEDDKSERLSPVVKDEESLIQANNDRLNNEQQFHSFFPYFISPYYQNNNNLPVFEKMSSLESLSKYMSSPPAHLSNLNASIDQNTGMLNPIYSLPPSPYSQPWRSSMFPFVFPPEYSYSSKDLTPIHHNFNKNNSPQRESKQRLISDEHKSKKSHIKKPLNAFMLFMKEQRSLVVQECTLRESAAINQILGRKWHELDRNVQQKYYDMARDERMKHMQLYPEWSARDNYGARKKRTVKGKKRERNQECLNQKKCRARFGLEQQANWCKHCKRKKKCLRYTENDFIPNTNPSSSDDDDDTDTIEDSNDGDVIQIIQADHHHQPKITIDSDEENKLRLLKYRFKDY